MFGVVGEDDLVEGGGGFFVCQTHQQFLPLDARSAVVVADEFGEVEGVVGLFPVHLVDGQVAGLYGYAVTAVYVVLQHIVLVRDIKADVIGKLAHFVVAPGQRIEVECGALYGDYLSGTSEAVEVGEFQLVVVTRQSLHIGQATHVAGVDEVLYSAFQGSKVGAGGVVPDTGIGIVGVYAESQHLSGPLVGDFLVVEVDAHGRIIHHESGDTLPVVFGNKDQSGEFLLELVLGIEVVVLGHEVIQQLLSP